MKESIRSKEEGNIEVKALLKYLLLAYILTAVSLLILALLLYKAGISEKIVSVCMILIYSGTNFLAGFLAGKEFKKMKFIWGLLLGISYFLLLVVLSLIGGRAGTIFGKDFLTTFLLCAGGGMLGGMFS